MGPVWKLLTRRAKPGVCALAMLNAAMASALRPALMPALLMLKISWRVAMVGCSDVGQEVAFGDGLLAFAPVGV
jgi:hypothetical protein